MALHRDPASDRTILFERLNQYTRGGAKPVLPRVIIIPMTDTDRKQLQQKIVESIARMEKEVVHLEEATQPIAPENAIGRVSRMDAINNKSVSEAALRAARRKLYSLRLALTKIDSPAFGICSR